jgi:hypothetical protein
LAGSVDAEAFKGLVHEVGVSALPHSKIGRSIPEMKILKQKYPGTGSTVNLFKLRKLNAVFATDSLPLSAVANLNWSHNWLCASPSSLSMTLLTLCVEAGWVKVTTTLVSVG